MDEGGRARRGARGAGTCVVRGCGWPVAVTVKIPPEWRSGFYQAALRAVDGGGTFVQRNRCTADGAWVADGDARDVAVHIPELGEVRLHARPDGAVYIASIGDGGNLVKDTGL